MWFGSLWIRTERVRDKVPPRRTAAVLSVSMGLACWTALGECLAGNFWWACALREYSTDAKCPRWKLGASTGFSVTT